MKRNSVIQEIKDEKYFRIDELVCPHILARHGEDRAWMFLSTVYLETLLVIRRDIIQEPMIINNHRVGGNFTQRGVRCCQCAIVKSKTYAYIACCSINFTYFYIRKMSCKKIRLIPCLLEKTANFS